MSARVSLRSAFRFASAACALTLAGGAMAQQGRGSQAQAPQQQQQPQAPRQEKTFPLGTPWIGSSINGRPFTTQRPTIIIDGALRAQGFSGCNTFSATAYPLRGQGMAVGPVALTRKACDKATMDAERAFLLAFRAVQAWDVEAGVLVLKGRSGELRFERSF
jgi:heat shock protein HslJ